MTDLQKDDRDYANGEIVVHWRPAKCEKCSLCHEGLPEVFQPRERPWVKLDGADLQRITKQINECPPQALSYTLIAKT